MIKGERINLRYLNLKDAEFLYKTMNLPDAKRYVGREMATSLPKAKEWIKNKIKQRREGRSFDFVIFLRGAKEKIGTINLFGIDKYNRSGTVGLFYIHKKYRNKDFGKEALKMILNFGFNRLGLHKIKLFSINPIMIRVAKKCGMKEEAKLKKEILLDGKWVDDVVLSVFKK